MLKRISSIIFVLSFAILMVFPVSAKESEDIYKYCFVSENGIEISFDSLEDAENFVEETYAVNISLDQSNGSIVSPMYVPCPVGPGPCGKDTLLYSIMMKDSSGKPIGEVFYYGCAMCDTVDHKLVVRYT